MSPDQPRPNDPDLMFDQQAVLTDMSDVTPVEHRFDRIVGNQLLCSLHDTCVGKFIKPTEVLEEVNGELVLVDKA